MPRHRVAITGIGMVTALGSDATTAWQRLVAGENGIRTITYFDASQYGTRVAAEVREALGDPVETCAVPLEFLRRGPRLFLKVAREAFEDARLRDAELPPARIGAAVGVSVNYVNQKTCRHHFQFRHPGVAEINLARFARESEEPRALFYRRQGDLVGAATAKMLGLGGPNLIVDAACAASSYAIAEAYRLIGRGEVDAMVAGGACSIVSPIGLLAFTVLGALSSNPDPATASRPFDRNRDGFVMGEGAGAVVLERYDRAVTRKATIYGELAGCGMSMNATTLTDPSDAGESEAHAMRVAMTQAGLSPEDIAYIAAHGTSTPKNDVTETLAIKRVFQTRASRVAVSSNKAQIGHTISAAGVCNLIGALKAMQHGVIPPTAHYRDPDPRCDLDYVPGAARRASVGAALVNAFAFGGQNVVLAVKAAA